MRRKLRRRSHADENEHSLVKPTISEKAAPAVSMEHSAEVTNILRMQQLQGNAFVQRFLGERSGSPADTLQRAPEDDLPTAGTTTDDQSQEGDGAAAAEAGADNEELLFRGKEGPAVSDIQEQLNHAADPTGTNKPIVVDGKFGNKTFKMVTFFQRHKDIKIDGVVGPVTRAALKEPEAFIGAFTGRGKPSGTLVNEVTAGGPAAAGGLLVGDLIVTVDKIDINNDRQFRSLIEGHSPGDTIEIVVQRGSSTDLEILAVTLTNRGNG